MGRFYNERKSIHENSLESLRLLVLLMGHVPENYNLGIWIAKN